jgi:hypothetical protein
MLRSGVGDESIKFTNKGDVDVVAAIYKRAFLDEMTAATKLYYPELGWGSAHMATLAAALTYAHASGSLAQLTVCSHLTPHTDHSQPLEPWYAHLPDSDAPLGARHTSCAVT